MLLYCFDYRYAEEQGGMILTVLGMVESFSSIIWTRRYNTCGDFELVVPATAENVALLTRGRYLVRDVDVAREDGDYGAKGSMRNVMVIQNREVTTDAEEGDSLLIIGQSLQSVLRQRIISRQTNLDDYVDGAVVTLLEQNIMATFQDGRDIPDFSHMTTFPIDTRHRMRQQITGKNLGEAVEEICQTYGYGFDVNLIAIDRASGRYNLSFWMYEGKDRSLDQTENVPVIFSRDFENLISSDYLENGADYASIAYVAGEGEGDARKILTVGGGEGLDRFEVWVDSRNTSSNDGTIPAAVYRAMLKQEGNEALAEHAVSSEFNAEVEPNGIYTYGTDYDLGDVVTVITDYSAPQRVRISEVTEAEEESGATTVITFADPDLAPQSSSDVVNLFDKDNPHVYSRMYLSAAGTITRLSSTSSPDRTVYVSIESGKAYRVSCNVSSVKRVGTYTARAEGATATAYAGHSTASANDLVVTAGANDTVLCLQLFADSDSQKTLSAYYPSLWIYEN